MVIVDPVNLVQALITLGLVGVFGAWFCEKGAEKFVLLMTGNLFNKKG